MAVKAGSLEEYSLLERWGKAGNVPATLLLESCVHAARWLVEASSSFTQSCILRDITYWRSMDDLLPGERFCVSLRVADRSASHLSLAAYQTRVMPGESVPGVDFRRCEDEADGLFSVAFAPLGEWHSPGDRECLWRELRP